MCDRIGFKMSRFLLLSIVIFHGALMSSANIDSIDVEEGQNVVLKCRFPAELSRKDSTLYWIRTNRKGHDNVAIGQTPFQASYQVDHRPDEGIYDLSISSATYDRDNGHFECRMKEGGTGNEFYSKSVELTVLLEPSAPTIVSLNPTVTEGKPLNLTCESKGGSPAPEIKWFIKGQREPLDTQVIPGINKDIPTRSILSIIPSKEDDGTSYRCTVWNRALGKRQKYEAFTKIYVNYFPRVQVGPENPLKVEKDDTATLQCQVDAKPSVKEVRWTRNGRFINTNFNHTIPRVTLQSSGSYMCSAQNGLGQPGTSELKLDVLFAPVVNLPERREVKEGEDVSIDCQVDANPRPTSIQWFRQGHEFMQNGPTLRLSKVSAKDNGVYTCSASNTLKPTGKPEVTRIGNATIEINIRHKPGKAVITPENPTAIVGKSVALRCGANPPGYPLPQYRWWKEGSNSKIADGPEFVIESARLSHGGKYYCQPANGMGEGVAASIDLEVFQAPKIITHLKPTIVKRTGDAGFQITCSAVGKPKPNIRWYKDGEEIIDSESNMYHIVKQEQETMSNMAYNVLSTLKYVGRDRISDTHLMHTDRGHYTCQFDNEVAKAETTMFLRIEHSPVVVHQHNKVAYDIGDTAFISCKMQAYPRPTFDWTFGNSLLQNDPKFYSSNITALDNDVYEGILRIHKVTDLSYGDYNCKGTNAIGNKRTIIKLTKRGKPERPTNVRPVAREYNSILVGWDNGFNGGYNDTEYTIQYSKHAHSSPEYKECHQSNPCDLTGLDQFSQYHIKVKASNKHGESKYSKEVSIITKVDVTQIPKPENVHFEKTTNMVSFHVRSGFLPLFAQIELKTSDGLWVPHHVLELGDATMGEMKIKAPVTKLRVKLCLETNDLLCGKYSHAKMVDVLPSAMRGALGKPWVIAVVIVTVLAGLVAIILMLKCCCCKSRTTTKKDMTKDRPTIIHSTQPPFGHGIENKGVDTLKDADEILKNNLYQNGYEQQSTSNTNSASGGSVNSQDSLWNVKGTDNNAALLAMQQQQMQHGYPGQQGYQAYDQMAMQYQQQQHHQGIPQQQGYPDEYAHYPYPDEYLNERNQQFLANNVIDAYGRPRQRMESDYSPYGDVSGLPDPYNGGQLLEEPQTPTQNGQMSFEDAIDGTGMTPNSRSRRIIREIIV